MSSSLSNYNDSSYSSSNDKPNPDNLVNLGENLSVSVGMSTTNEDSLNPENIRNPWLKTAYSAALEFYDNDKNLTKKDREELSQKFVNIARTQALGGWSAFALVFGTPFAVKFYKTNAIKGVQVPRNFIIGIAAMIFSTITCGKYAYSSTLQNLKNSTYEENIGDKSYRQYQIMKLISPGESPKWAMYYKNTSINPQRAVQDPRTLLPNVQKKLDQRNGQPPMSPMLHNRDPFNLYSGPEFDKFKQDQKHNDYPADLQASKPPQGLSSSSLPSSSSSFSLKDGKDILDVDIAPAFDYSSSSSSSSPSLKNNNGTSDPNEDDPFFNKTNSSSAGSDSAWDKIRKNNSGSQ